MKQLKHCKNPMKKERVYKLKDIHGTFYPSELTASIGPSGRSCVCVCVWAVWPFVLSFIFHPCNMARCCGTTGAGKTTLLNLLAGRATGKIEGDVLINGVKKKEVGRQRWRRL